MKLIYPAGPIASRNLYSGFNNIFKLMRLYFELLNDGYAAVCTGGDILGFMAGLFVPNDKVMASDIAKLLKCDAMILLDGWEASPGCRAEVAAAHVAGIPVYYDMESLLREVKP